MARGMPVTITRPIRITINGVLKDLVKAAGSARAHLPPFYVRPVWTLVSGTSSKARVSTARQDLEEA